MNGLVFDAGWCCGPWELASDPEVLQAVSRRSLRCTGCGVVRRFTVTCKVDRTAPPTPAQVIPLRTKQARG